MWVNGVDIFNDMNKAYTAYYAKEYEEFGKNLGAAMALSFIGSMKGGLRGLSDADIEALIHDLDNEEEYNRTLEKFYQLHLVRRQTEEQEVGEIMHQHYAPDELIAALPTYDEDGDAFYDAQELQNLQVLEESGYYLY